MKYIYVLLSSLFFSSAVFAMGPITGASSGACVGSSIILYDTTLGGSWSSSATGVATVGSITGVLTGISAGSAVITYAVGSGYVTAVVNIHPYVMPSVSITTNTGDTVCAGTPVTYTAVIVNGGTDPTFVWTLNSAIAGTDSSYNAIPGPNDTVRVIMTSNIACTHEDTAINSILITVLPALIPSISIAAIPGLSIGRGESDTLVAVDTTSGGGSFFTYQWVVNSTPIPGANSATYVTDSLSNGDSVTCIVTSVGRCGGDSTFNSVTIAVGPSGIKSLPASNDINVFPNPNNGAFTLSGSWGATSIGADENVSVEITDMLGQTVYKNKIMAKGGNLNGHISLGGLHVNGVYLMRLSSGNTQMVLPVIIGN